MATVALSGIITPTNVVTATSTTTLTNKTLTGAVMNGTLGATTPSTVVATTVQASTTMGVGGATPSASGAGITFPAIASVSTNANTLDDYEEGTWTPTQGANLTVIGTFSSTGSYTKIGNLVSVRGTVSATTSVSFTAAGAEIAAGLPFATTTTFDQTGVAINGGNTTSSAVFVYNLSVDGSGSIAATPLIGFSIVYKV
jgi:hypothetical protein